MIIVGKKLNLLALTANLEIQVHAILKVSSWREAFVLPHEVCHGEVAVSSLTLGQEDRVVEANIFVASYFLEIKISVVKNEQTRRTFINSWLTRCVTARGSGIGLVTVGPTKV